MKNLTFLNLEKAQTLYDSEIDEIVQGFIKNQELSNMNSLINDVRLDLNYTLLSLFN